MEPMDCLSIYNRGKQVPEEAKKKITGGRLVGKTDINPMWRIKKLTELFGPCGIGWYYNVTRQWLELHGDTVAAFVNIELFICVDGNWSKPILGSGGSMFAEKEKTGVHVSDECYKMATTDALSVACKQLGIGADVYWDKDATKYPTDKAEDKPNDRLIPIYEELKRIGYTEKSICKTYKIDDINAMSNLQIKDFLQRAKKLPDKDSIQN